MIDKKIEDFILNQSETFMIPASNVAVLYAEHNIAHAKLMLSQYKYSRVPVTLEEMMHKLIKEPFLPVVKRQEFMGIVVRQEILKAFSAFAHDFTKYYEITKRD